MRILFTLNSGNPGGMERHVADLVKGLTSIGHKVYVWCSSGPITGWYEKAGAQVTECKIRMDVDPSYIKNLSQFVKENDIDIIHAHELKASVNSVFVAKLFAHCKVVTHIHTPISQWKVPSVKRIPTSLFYAIVNKIFGVTELALTEIGLETKTKEGIPRKNIRIIPNAIDFSRFTNDMQLKANYKKEFRSKFNIPLEAKVFGIVSRLTQEKGIETAIRGFSLYCKSNTGYLLIAGDGSLKDSLLKLCHDLEVADKVIFTGMFQDQDLVRIYASLDYFIFPTLAEGFGLVLVEAMASRTPVICSNLPVLQEVSGGRARFFDVGNPKDLSEKMAEAIQSQNALDVDEIYSWARSKYDMPIFIQQYNTLYTEVLKDKI